jgi:hypothetical protein
MGGAKGKCSFGMNCMELTIVDEIANFVKESNHKKHLDRDIVLWINVLAMIDSIGTADINSKLTTLHNA